MKKRATNLAKICEQNFIFITMYKGNDLSPYTVLLAKFLFSTNGIR